MVTARASIYHDTRRANAEGLYPVKLRVHYNYSDKRYSLNHYLSKEDFKLSYLTQKPKLKKHSDIKDELVALELKAKSIIKDLETFDYETFEKKMFRPTSSIGNIFYYYEQTISALKKANRISTASNYELSQKSVKAFLKANNKKEDYLSFDAVTKHFLECYESWMIQESKELTTVGIYLRPLRALFNQAIEAKEITEDIYPFSKTKYQIPAGSNVKKALSRDDLKNLYQYVTDDPYIIKARAFWFFSYVCNGINVRDICELKYKNVKKDTIEFIRTKTKRTTKSKQTTIVAALTPLAEEVIKIYGNAKNSPETYVFPVLTHTMDEEKKHKAVQAFTRFINQHMKRLAKLTGVNEDISTYFARHTFSTLSVRSGRSVEFIQKTLGHQSIKTTMGYLGSLESEEIKKNASDLMNF